MICDKLRHGKSRQSIAWKRMVDSVPRSSSPLVVTRMPIFEIRSTRDSFLTPGKTRLIKLTSRHEKLDNRSPYGTTRLAAWLCNLDVCPELLLRLSVLLAPVLWVPSTERFSILSCMEHAFHSNFRIFRQDAHDKISNRCSSNQYWYVYCCTMLDFICMWHLRATCDTWVDTHVWGRRRLCPGAISVTHFLEVRCCNKRLGGTRFWWKALV